jgi:IS5 family transposase
MKGMCERWLHPPLFQEFTGEDLFRYEFRYERADLRHLRKRLEDKLSRRSSATWAAAISKVALELQPTSSARLCCAPLKPAANDPAQ